ncbi:hypothetical protein HYG77_18075 [Rhodococcus sp. ZPP]|uniref:hypothetical protein n=1 Tax=Rhodococcus sp. ZPP TaxID=2749906 RepID=UPI001AD860AA|nr:hypothetical protein [Rhodococcus sp. ZPP]QTJ67295.1 hypothetical protein HYG77_18075 [Rhodococcus sp. ZPP]
MIPTVAQQIGAVRNTIAKTVLPALDPNDSFAAEQAGLVLACLDWVLDVHASEYPYELAEHTDNRCTLEVLADLDPGVCDESQTLLAETATPPADLEQIRAQVRRLKEAVAHSYQVLAAAGSPDAAAARRTVTDAAARQVARELSWCRMTGFPRGEVPNITEILAS